MFFTNKILKKLDDIVVYDDDIDHDDIDSVVLLHSLAMIWTFLLKTLLICDMLRDLVPFIQFKKPEKHHPK